MLAQSHLPDYDGVLLAKAADLGERLLKAFDTPTGIPLNRINLRNGVVRRSAHVETCAACAGTLLLEFGVLSRLTGDSRYENAARRALFALYERRSELGLLGNVIDSHSGLWTWSHAHTGAGIDSLCTSSTPNSTNTHKYARTCKRGHRHYTLTNDSPQIYI